jgi:hypothetical protein
VSAYRPSKYLCRDRYSAGTSSGFGVLGTSGAISEDFTLLLYLLRHPPTVPNCTIDELGFISFDRPGRELLFNLMTDR